MSNETPTQEESLSRIATAITVIVLQGSIITGLFLGLAFDFYASRK